MISRNKRRSVLLLFLSELLLHFKHYLCDVLYKKFYPKQFFEKEVLLSSFVEPWESELAFTLFAKSSISFARRNKIKQIKHQRKQKLPGIWAAHCTEMRFASLLSGEFTTMAVINPPENKLAKCTSVRCVQGSPSTSCQLHSTTSMVNFKAIAIV